jgi:aminobenzoyl-glutamate utilization protein B
VDVFEDTTLVEKVRQEFLEARWPDFQYEPLLGDRKPPLDYRK